MPMVFVANNEIQEMKRMLPSLISQSHGQSCIRHERHCAHSPPPDGSPERRPHAHQASPADLTSHAPLHLDDVRGRGEPQAPQDTFAALELIHLQDGSCFLQLSLRGLNVHCDLGHRKHEGSAGQ